MEAESSQAHSCTQLRHTPIGVVEARSEQTPTQIANVGVEIADGRYLRRKFHYFKCSGFLLQHSKVEENGAILDLGYLTLKISLGSLRVARSATIRHRSHRHSFSATTTATTTARGGESASETDTTSGLGIARIPHAVRPRRRSTPSRARPP